MNQHNLKGKFHAHITLLTEDDHFVAPKGWKTTIILLAKGDRTQKDVMITRHYHTDTTKTQNVKDMVDNMKDTSVELFANGHTVLRMKLEHESLPTLNPTEQNYRECHIKVKKKVNDVLRIPEGLVQSRNPMVVTDTHETVFYNARFYKGTVEQIDKDVEMHVLELVAMNQDIQVLEVKVESTVWDTNLQLDKWWA